MIALADLTIPFAAIVAVIVPALNEAGIRFRDLRTTQSSLEDIFVGLIGRKS